MNAVWYRHWLEMRGGLLVASGVIVVLALAYPVFVLTGGPWLDAAAAGTSPLGAAARGVIDANHLAAWLPHVWCSSIAAWVVGIFIWGTGIRTSSLQPNHPSVVYTLTLPVARDRLLWSRFAAGCAAAVLLSAALLAVNTVTALAAGRPVPIAAMSLVSAHAALLLMTVVAVLGLVGIWDEQHFGWFLPVAAIAAVYVAWPMTIAFVGGPSVHWGGVATLVLIAAAAVSATLLIARRRDF